MLGSKETQYTLDSHQPRYECWRESRLQDIKDGRVYRIEDVASELGFDNICHKNK